MFIAFPGRTKDEAFDLGHEIAEAVTLDNPKPIKLRFEKVFTDNAPLFFFHAQTK